MFFKTRFASATKNIIYKIIFIPSKVGIHKKILKFLNVLMNSVMTRVSVSVIVGFNNFQIYSYGKMEEDLITLLKCAFKWMMVP